MANEAENQGQVDATDGAVKHAADADPPVDLAEVKAANPDVERLNADHVDAFIEARQSNGGTDTTEGAGEEPTTPEEEPVVEQSTEERAEDRQAAAVASAAGAVPPPAAPQEPETEEEVERREAVASVANTLVDIPFEQLTALRGAVDHALTLKGTEPETPGPSLEEISGSLPHNVELSEEWIDNGVAEVAEKIGVPEEEVLNFAVRQAKHEATGQGIGPSFLRVVLVDSSKRVVRL